MSAEPDRGLLELGEATVRGGPHAPADARGILARWLEGRFEARLQDDACLLVSELVTNSVRHAGQPPGAPVRISASAGDRLLRVAVTDQGHGRVRRRPPGSGDGGFGLALLEHLASRWGTTHKHSTQVWFELTAGAARA